MPADVSAQPGIALIGNVGEEVAATGSIEATILAGDNVAKRLAASRIGLGVRAENRGVCGV
jgi:hypothetical protein